ncbi:MAG TPA: SRPBCC family protein [Bryobacteraceae bacterium]|nr:SRPBCC family protein [Bryobacteraceae bacterium]
MKHLKAAAAGLAAGSIYMYFADPDRGRRRRALACDKARRAWRGFTDLTDKARRDAAHRAVGALAGVRALFADRSADNDVLVQRVRSGIGRVVSHPHAIEATAKGGSIVLTGDVLADEVDRLLRRVRRVPGVREVVNRLKIHERSEHISSLQGGQPRSSRLEWMQQSWTPSLRLGAGVAGAGLMAYGMRQGGARGLAANMAGAALLARAVSNRKLRDMVGIGDNPRVIEFQKTVHVQAPIEDVFAFWSDYSKFPRFMSHLKEVRRLGDGRWRWVADGPAGIPISWDVEMTQLIPNKLLAWRSIPGSKVDTEGTIRFDENSKGGTRITIHLCYKPPAGVLGHFLASLFGAHPKREMDDDMVRLKSLIELGRTRAHGARVTRAELAGETLH